jgi:hypothetical protein
MKALKITGISCMNHIAQAQLSYKDKIAASAITPGPAEEPAALRLFLAGTQSRLGPKEGTKKGSANFLLEVGAETWSYS